MLLICGRVSYAHHDPAASVPSVRALRTEASITVDGVLDEPFWQQAEVSGQFTDLRTGDPAKEQTSVRIAYTRTHVYIAVECFDSHMDQIHASELREDRFFKGDDWVEVHVDPAHSHRAKYAFFSNPLGTRVDASEGPGGEFSTAWSAEWELEAHMYEDRWTFEMSLPLGIMNYTQADDQTWGINFTRKLIHTDTISFWSFNDTDYFKPRFFGHLTDLNLADSQFDRNMEFTPYVSSRVDTNGQTDTDAQTGADVSFRLSPSVITAWTLNPDFGQVESDADTIELRDTERFLPEKRLFFREGDELLRMKNRLYYSRRFTDIDAGAKASGDWGDYKFSFLNIYGDTTHSGVTHGGNSSVFRVLQNVGQNSNLGYYASASEFELGHSRVLGQDGSFYVDENWHYRYQLAVSDDRLPDDLGAATKDRTDYLGHTSLNYENYPWDIVAGYDGISQGFDPVLGFIPRRNIFGPFVTTAYGIRSSTQWYKDFKVVSDVRYYEDNEHEAQLRDYNFEASVNLQNDIGFSGAYEDEYHAPFNNTRTETEIELFESDYWRSLDLGWAFGTFEEVGYDELIFGKRFKPMERWPIRYEFTIRFEEEQPHEDDTIWLNRVVFDYFFSDDMWLKGSIQHRSTNVHNVSFIYGWEFITDAKWYLVYNNVRQDETSVHTDIAQSLFTKVAFTFR